eukprot:6253990-Heterocapsa_arctica.AAC.1
MAFQAAANQRAAEARIAVSQKEIFDKAVKAAIPAAALPAAEQFDLLLAVVEQFTIDLRVASRGGVDASYGSKAYCASGGVRYELKDRGPGMMKRFVREETPATRDAAA